MIKVTTKASLKGLEEFARKLKRLDGTHDLSWTNLYNTSFVSRHTEFASMQEMADAAGITDPEQFNGSAWDQFVADHSDFAGWHAMREAAIGEWTQRKLRT